MKTFPATDERTGHTVAFEIENAYISPSTVADVLSRVKGVSDIRRRRPFSERYHIHLRFRYRNAECAMSEPFGDNSRYWISQQDSEELIDIGDIEQAFAEF